MRVKFIIPAIAIAFLFTGGAGAQVVLTAQKATLSEQDKAFFDRHIENQNYAAITLNTDELSDSIRTHEYCNVQLYISEQWNWELYLVPNGPEKFKGKTADNEIVLISIGENYFHGTIFSNKGDYLIRSSWFFTQNFTDESLIAFKASDFSDIGFPGIDDIKSDQLSVYPNPAAEILHIDCNAPINGGMEINIFDTLGQMVMTYKEPEEKALLNLKELNPGIYLVRVILLDNGKSITKRIVVQK